MNNTYGVSLKDNIFNYFVLFFRNFVSGIAENAAKIGNSSFRILFDKTTSLSYLTKTKKKTVFRSTMPQIGFRKNNIDIVRQQRSTLPRE